jgi:hypothetical protein
MINYRFNISVSGNTTGATQNQVAVLQVGKGFVNGNNALTGTPIENNALLHSRLGVSFGATAGQFSLRDISGALNTPFFSGTQTVNWVMNNSTKTISYVAPDGSDELLGVDRWDLWIGTTKVFNEKTGNSASDVVLSDLKFAFTTGIGMIDIDSMVITGPSASLFSRSASSYTSLTHSHTATVKNSKDILGLSLCLSGGQTLQVSVSSPRTDKANMNIYSLNGQKLFTRDLKLTAGRNNFNVPVTYLAPGVNIVVLSNPSGQVSKKIIK